MAKIPRPPSDPSEGEDRSPLGALPKPSPGEPRSIYEVAELSPIRAGYWLAMDGWSAAESAMLLCAVDPGAVIINGGLDRLSALNWPLHFDDLHLLLVRAGEAAALTFPAMPGEVLIWADRKNLRMPASFISYLAARELPVSPRGDEGESPEQRRTRLRLRKSALEAEGRRDATKRLAEEEGISPGRVRQLLAENKTQSASKHSPTPFTGLGRR